MYNDSVQDSQLYQSQLWEENKRPLVKLKLCGWDEFGNYVALCDYHDYHVQGEVTSVHILHPKNKSKKLNPKSEWTQRVHFHMKPTHPLFAPPFIESTFWCGVFNFFHNFM